MIIQVCKAKRYIVKLYGMKIKLVKDNNPIMRQRSKPVELPLSKEDRATLDAMLDYLKKSQDEEYAKKHNIREGVGLAAIQTGLLKRMFVVYFDYEDEHVEYQLVNPQIIETSVKKCALQNGEGCLSVDDEHLGLVHRAYRIKMKAFDALSNQDVLIDARGFKAVVLQHEYDHLNGVFFYDHIDNKNPDKKLINEEIL